MWKCEVRSAEGGEMRKWGPITKESAESYKPCPICGGRFVAGHEITLIPIEPADEEERYKMEQGKAYNAIASVVHWGCFEAIKDKV